MLTLVIGADQYKEVETKVTYSCNDANMDQGTRPRGPPAVRNRRCSDVEG